MKLYKIITFIFILGLTTSAIADDRWYFGYSVGKSDPGFALNDTIKDLVIDLPDALNTLGAPQPPFTTSSSFNNAAQKAYVGIRFGGERRWAFEGTYTNFGTYVGTVSTNYHYKTDTAEFDATGTVKTSAKLKGVSLSLVHFFPLGLRWSLYPRLGLSYVQGDVVTKETHQTSLSEYEETETEQGSKVKKDKLQLATFVVGVGVTYNVNDRWAIRSEWERYGNPLKEPYVDVYTIGFMYGFKIK